MADTSSAAFARWQARVERELGADPLESLTTETIEGVQLQPLYVADTDRPPRFAGVPARSTAAWQRCQCYDDPDPELVARQVEEDTSQGVDAVWVRLDRASRGAIEPAAGIEAVGEDGVAIGAVDDLVTILRATPRNIALSIDAGANALPVAAMTLAALARVERDATEPKLRFNADPFGALARDGELPAGLDTLVGEAALLARYCGAELPEARALTVSGAAVARAGGDSVQQIAVVAAAGATMLRGLEQSGLAPSAAAPQFALSLELGRDLLMQVCKLRAARWVWATMLAACGVDRATTLLHTATGWRTLTARDPWVNMLRVAAQTTAAVLGGADSISSAPFDVLLGRSDARGRRVARNTQTILAHESHLGEVADPVGGAYAVEALTESLARGAWALLREIENVGLAVALRDGRLHQALDDAWARRYFRLGEGHDAVLGVSRFAPVQPREPQREQPDKGAVRAAVQTRLNERRSPAAELGAVTAAAAASPVVPDAVMQALIAAAAAGATVFELSTALRPGADRERSEPLPARRDTEPLDESPAMEGGDTS